MIFADLVKSPYYLLLVLVFRSYKKCNYHVTTADRVCRMYVQLQTISQTVKLSISRASFDIVSILACSFYMLSNCGFGLLPLLLLLYLIVSG